MIIILLLIEDLLMRYNYDLRRKNYFNMIGNKYGRLTVLDFAEDYISSRGSHLCQFLCLCDCGKQVIVQAANIKNGSTKSCGCLVKEHINRLNAKGHEHNKKYNEYDLSGEYGIGYTRKGDEFYFDLEDYDKIKDICWVKGTGGYITGRIPAQKKNIEMQRFIMGVTDHNVCVDHIITERKNDNRKQNLRIVTKKENNINRRMMSNNTSGVIGVRWDKNSNKWEASIGINKKTIHLGEYEDKEDAIKARKEAEIKYFGEYRYRGGKL